MRCRLRRPSGVSTHALLRPSRIANYALEDVVMHGVQVWEGLTVDQSATQVICIVAQAVHLLRTLCFEGRVA